jgi:hypothetical protein
MPYQVYKRDTPDQNGHSRIVIDDHDALPPGWEDAKFLLSEDVLPSELRAAIEVKGYFSYRDWRFVEDSADEFCRGAQAAKGI